MRTYRPVAASDDTSVMPTPLSNSTHTTKAMFCQLYAKSAPN